MNYNYFFTAFFSIFCFFSFGQIEIEEGKVYRWFSILNSKQNDEIFKKEDELFYWLYKNVEMNVIKLQQDNLKVGNFGHWDVVPPIKYFLQPNSPEVYYTQCAKDFLTITQSKDNIKKDSYGNEIIKYDSDGNQYYEFENETRTLQLQDLAEIQLLEEGKMNRKTKQFDFKIIAISFKSNFLNRQAWISWSDLLSSIPNAKNSELVKRLLKREYIGFQYRQEGLLSEEINSQVTQIMRKLPKSQNNELLFDSHVYKRIENLVNVEKLKIHFRYSHEEWIYLWESVNFEIPIKDTIPLVEPNENSICLLARKGKNIVDNNANPIYQIDAEGNEKLVLEEDVNLYFDCAKITEIRVVEEKVWDNEKTDYYFAPSDVIFVLDKNGLQNELFLVNLNELKHADSSIENELWFQYILSKKYQGNIYFQRI